MVGAVGRLGKFSTAPLRFWLVSRKKTAWKLQKVKWRETAAQRRNTEKVTSRRSRKNICGHDLPLRVSRDDDNGAHFHAWFTSECWDSARNHYITPAVESFPIGPPIPIRFLGTTSPKR